MDEIADFARQRIEAGSKSFAAASRLFDPRTRSSVYMLYAWCRHCDDEIDDQILGFATTPGTTAPAQRLAALEAKTREAIAGRASEPEFVALTRVLQHHAIPENLPFEHLAGFAMDARDATYETIDDTLQYCWHVAGAVGVMMSCVMGAGRDGASGRETLERASDLGIAFQLTNISRDVMDDAATGRVYLPADWLAAEGVTPDKVAAPENRAAVHKVTARMLALADAYYASATWGIAQLPPRSALAVSAARTIYRAIGKLVVARGAQAWDHRAVVSKPAKIGALFTGAGLVAMTKTRALFATAPPRTGLWTPPNLPE